jgi:Putative prokaryotic signal transducing protein
MAYCPVCTASYGDDDYACPDCRTPLARGTWSALDPDARPIALVELYRCWNGLEADRLAGLLEARGIPARVRSMGIAGYPLTIAPFAERRVTVDGDLVGAARRVILQAIADGYVSSDGAWIVR